jgi:hypothetical protein
VEVPPAGGPRGRRARQRNKRRHSDDPSPHVPLPCQLPVRRKVTSASADA